MRFNASAGEKRRLSVVVLSTITILLMLLSAFSVAGTRTVAADYVTSDGYSYTLDSNNLATITGYNGPGGDITMPSTLGGYPVVAIRDGAFMGDTSLTAINVNPSNPNFASMDGVLYNKTFTTLIAFPGGKSGAFTVPSTVKKIEGDAFRICNSLTSVSIPDSVNDIGFGAFSECINLASVSIDSGVTTIGGEAFAYCPALTTVTMANGVASLGALAFAFCPSLISLAMPDSLTTIGNGAFREDSALASIDIPGGVHSIESEAFIGCSALASVTIGDGVMVISDGAFEGCSALISVVIPNSVTDIEYSAFEYCTALTSVTFGRGVTNIGAAAFWYCSALASLTFYGIVAPTSVGEEWIGHTSASIQGHAYSTSNFPAPGNYFNGLLMGDYIAGVTVTSPNGGEKWYPGTTYNITWATTVLSDPTTTATISLVDTENSANNKVLATGIPNSGTWSWWSLDRVTPSSTYKIKVDVMSGSSTYSDTSDNVFTVAAPPTVTLTAPNGGETWYMGTTHTFTWTATGDITGFYLALLHQKSDGTFEVVAAQNINDASVRSYSWKMTGLLTGTYKAYLEGSFNMVRDGRTTILWNEDYSDGPFSIAADTTPPTISGYINNQKIRTSLDVITVTISDSQSGVDWSTLKVVVDNKYDITASIHQTATGFTISGNFNTLSKGKHGLTVTVNDLAGNTATAKWSVIVQTK